MDDDVLVRETLAGDRRAFRQLVDRYRNTIYGLAINYVGDFDLAEDLAQEAFIRSYYRLPDLQDGQRFGSWLRTIAANLCRMELRRRAVHLWSRARSIRMTFHHSPWHRTRPGSRKRRIDR